MECKNKIKYTDKENKLVVIRGEEAGMGKEVKGVNYMVTDDSQT